MNTPTPFALEAEDFPFLDALILQCVASTTHLQWEPGNGGFFVEAETPPLEHFIPATLVTGSGKRVKGFAAQTTGLFFPVGSYTSWHKGKPANRVQADGYEEGAKSKTQVLAVLPDGRWALLTARGLASQALMNAVSDHRYTAAYKFKAQPFYKAMTGVAGAPRQAGEAAVTPFTFVSVEDETCPVDLGEAVRARWGEVKVWLNRGNGHNGQTQTATAEAVDGSGGEGDAPPPVVPGQGEPPVLRRYKDGSDVNGKVEEQQAYDMYVAVFEGKAPQDRAALRAWYKEQASREVSQPA